MPPAIGKSPRRQTKPASHDHSSSPDSAASGSPGNPSASQTPHTKPNAISRVTPNPPTAPIPSSSAIVESLRSLPLKRTVPWREGHEAHGDIELMRSQQRHAILMAERGQVRDPPCRLCENGNGCFTVCVALDGFFGGACSSCVFPSKGSMCSLRGQRLKGEKVGSVKTEDREASSEILNHENSSKKRKRKSTVKVLENADKKISIASNVSIPAVSSPSAQKPRSQLPSQPPARTHAQIEVQIVREEAERGGLIESDLLNATNKKHKNDRNPTPPLTKRTALPYSTNSTFSAHPYGKPARPQQNVSQQQHEDWSSKARIDSSSQHSARPSGSQFTSVNAPAPSHTQTQPQPQQQPTPIRNDSSEVDREKQQEKGVPLIDTFSRSQQRQVYGLIHGLQGGIDHLHKQLGSLKGLLGIEEDDG